VGKSNFAVALNNVHPGFPVSGRFNGRQRQGLGPKKMPLDKIQSKHEKRYKSQNE
jgi:hypothetical protein